MSEEERTIRFLAICITIVILSAIVALSLTQYRWDVMRSQALQKAETVAEARALLEGE